MHCEGQQTGEMTRDKKEPIKSTRSTCERCPFSQRNSDSSRAVAKFKGELKALVEFL